VATILLSGVDLFFRGKFDAMFGAAHSVVTRSETTPDLVVADVGEIDPVELVRSYPGTPILGYTQHTNTDGLRRARAAGIQRVVARSAIAERGATIVDELLSA
jgi:hypothetical protein